MNAPEQAEPHGGVGTEPGAVSQAPGPAAGHDAADLPPTTQLKLPSVSGPIPSRAGSADGTAQDREWLETITRLPATSALLKMGAGARRAQFLLNTDRTTVGRHLGSDIFLDHATVSRSHAVFERRGTEFRVRDLGSLNGTYVNGVDLDTAALRTGDRIQIGKFSMVFYQNPGVVPQNPFVSPAGAASSLADRRERPGNAREPGSAAARPEPSQGGWAAPMLRVRSWFAARRHSRSGG
jgi:pSer/pThr/pTyr-binding forkhead associated (FHA) protein